MHRLILRLAAFLTASPALEFDCGKLNDGHSPLTG
jgi:hypothetical protein